MTGHHRDLLQLFIAILVIRASARGQSSDLPISPAAAVQAINRILDQTFTSAATAADYAYQHIEKEMENIL